MGYDFHLSFGVNRQDLYLDTSMPNELVVQVAAGLPNTSTTGRLGPLELTAVDDPANPSMFIAAFTVDFVDPFDATDKVTLSELESSNFNPSSIVQATFSASANVNLDLVLGFGSDAIFPSISSTFSLAWSFTNTPTDANAASFGDAPQIAFDDVRINLGEFFSKFAAPILNEVKQLTDPIQPLIDFLHQRVPLISDLIGQSITWLDIANDLGRFHSNGVAEDLRYINATVALIDLLNNIPTDVDNISIHLGSFDLSGTDVRSLNDLSGIELADNQITPPVESPTAQIGGSSPSAADFFNKTQDMGDTGTGFKFPLLTTPSKAFNLILGKTNGLDLVTYDMAPLSVGYKFNVDIPYTIPCDPPVEILIHFTANMDAKAKLSFGFDTRRPALGGPRVIILLTCSLDSTSTATTPRFRSREASAPARRLAIQASAPARWVTLRRP